MDIGFVFSLFLRRLPYFLLVATTVTALGLGVALVLPPVFVAEARLLVESEQIPDELAASTVQTQATEQLQIIESRIMTRANLLEMANRLQIYAGQPVMPADDIVEDMRARTTIAQIGSTARNREGATLVRVAFEAPTAALSALVTNEYVTLILDANVTLRTGVAGQTLEFFRQQVARLDQELAERRRRILEFQQQNQAALPDSLAFRRSQQAAAQERLLQLVRDEATLKDRRTRLVDLYGRTGQTDLLNAELTPAQRALQQAEDELAAAVGVYSATHPQVRLLEARVATLQQRAQAQPLEAEPEAGSSAAAELSLYDLQLAEIDGQLDFIAEVRTQIEAELALLQETIDATPGNAIQLETLERDYENLRIQYDEAVANRARAETGDLIEALSKGERISVVEQAVPPTAPTRPNRRLIAAAGAGMGFALGLALIVALELLNKAIRRPVELTQRLGITPFASLPYIRTRRETRRRVALLGLALLATVGGIPAALWALDAYYLPLDLIFDRVVTRLGLAPLIDSLWSGRSTP